jgi:hypothetical protein
MFSSAKCGSHGLSASLDSSYPSLMASAVGADRFWQIDLGVIESINNEQRAAERSAALFVFGRSVPANGPITREHQPYFLLEFFLYQSFLLRLPLPEEDPPAAFEPPLPLLLRPGLPPRLFTFTGRRPLVLPCRGWSGSSADSGCRIPSPSSSFPILSSSTI